MRPVEDSREGWTRWKKLTEGQGIDFIVILAHQKKIPGEAFVARLKVCVKRPGRAGNPLCDRLPSQPRTELRRFPLRKGVGEAEPSACV